MPFYLNPPRTSALFRQFHGFFTDDDVAKTLNFVDGLPEQNATLEDNKVHSSIRRSKIKWIQSTKESEWLYSKIAFFIKKINAESFNFELTALADIQYTEYHGTDNGVYHDHMDWNCGQFLPRKLSLSIQLTDGLEYEGGNLQIKIGSTSVHTVSRGIGDAIVFPSFLLHGVAPVTTGIRKSLVVWVHGSEFR